YRVAAPRASAAEFFPPLAEFEPLANVLAPKAAVFPPARPASREFHERILLRYGVDECRPAPGTLATL
ncbi:MAG: hypothetical protein ACPG77_17130, partial [Nannocystaceae bacterium]